MTRMITIAVKEPADCWRVRHVKDSLKTYQDIVGGYIEQFTQTAGGIVMFCDEEGKLKDLLPNIVGPLGDVIFGTIFAVRADDEGEFQSLTDYDLLKLGAKGK